MVANTVMMIALLQLDDRSNRLYARHAAGMMESKLCPCCEVFSTIPFCGVRIVVTYYKPKH
jgi:hypothetical protein